jgi:protoporphyrin/coproporphyrin ferrochelatase
MNRPSMEHEPRGVLLMTYGSPSSAADVPRYLAAVRGGRPADAELIAEFTRRYEVIGWSPLIQRTEAQAAAVEAALGPEWRVRAAMRFSEPSIAAQLTGLVAEGVRDIVAIVLSPQFSPLLMGGYERDLATAVAALPGEAPRVAVAGAWFREPAFVAAMGERIREGLADAADRGLERPPVLLTAHSLPRRVAESEPAHLDQLAESARLIADAAGLAPSDWTFCWQSAGHEPGEWMSPDFADLMPRLRDAGHRAVLVAPIQFLSDHLEVLYDVDIGAREQAEAAGLAFARIQSLNVSPGLMEALAATARATAADALAGSTGRDVGISAR